MAEVSAPVREPKQARRSSRRHEGGAWYPRWFWPAFVLPGTIWLVIMFVLPFYVILSVAFGTVDLFRNPLPVWQPWYWTTQYFQDTLGNIFGGDAYLQRTYVRTFAYVAIASILCLVIGYAVAYYVARYGGKRKVLLLVLLISPFWISYLMRMLAWVNLLENDGYVNKIITSLNIVPQPVKWLEGQHLTVILGLVYGYIPYMILPLFGFLDRIHQSLLEAGRDLGAGPAQTFWRVTLPLSKPAILAGLVIVTLPMFGDYYTTTLLSGSPRTTMIGNLLDDAVNSPGQGPSAAVFVILMMILLLIPMLYYMRSTARSQGSGT